MWECKIALAEGCASHRIGIVGGIVCIILFYLITHLDMKSRGNHDISIEFHQELKQAESSYFRDFIQYFGYSLLIVVIGIGLGFILQTSIFSLNTFHTLIVSFVTLCTLYISMTKSNVVKGSTTKMTMGQVVSCVGTGPFMCYFTWVGFFYG